MNLVFVNGWSVTHTNTYGRLHAALSAIADQYRLNITIQHIQLGKYISFHDEVTLDDIARALDKALRELPGNTHHIQAFSAITHSTGGPVVRYWLDKYYGAKDLGNSPLRHLVMLAPANHGSALGILGKERVGRMKAWFSGVEPGQGVLDWLCLGSEGQWQLNENYLAYSSPKNGFFPFVLTGQGIDTKLYDFLNSYLVEPGSDGAVRVCGANLNYRFLALKQSDELLRQHPPKTRLVGNERRPVKISNSVPLGIFSMYSHSGEKMGIMRSPSPSKNNPHPVVTEILKCLAVKTEEDYKERFRQLKEFSDAEQEKIPEGKKQKISRYAMLVFNVHDENGNRFQENDFEVYLLAGSTYQPSTLPKGFLVDKQMNKQTRNLVYYVDVNKMSEIKDGLFGIRILARPTSGFSYYQEAEFRSEGLAVDKVFSANETTYVDITLKRLIDKNVFRFRRGDQGHEDFKDVKPSGQTVD